MLKVAIWTIFSLCALPSHSQGGLLGLLHAKKDRPPAPNMTIQLLGEDWYVLPQPATIGFYLVLPDGSHATGLCFIAQVQGMKPCGVQPFAAEKRLKHPCFTPGGPQATCFEPEWYKANRTGNTLVVYSADGPSYMDIVGTWDSIQTGTIPNTAPGR